MAIDAWILTLTHDVTFSIGGKERSITMNVRKRWFKMQERWFKIRPITRTVKMMMTLATSHQIVIHTDQVKNVDYFLVNIWFIYSQVQWTQPFNSHTILNEKKEPLEQSCHHLSNYEEYMYSNFLKKQNFNKIGQELIENGYNSKNVQKDNQCYWHRKETN